MKNLERDLFSLVTLVSNVTEAYSACLFLENKRRGAFQLTAFHSLSPQILPDATVKSGQGFLGWVLENNEPLSINQFEKDTIVLGYYGRNEDIKSFMATPLPSSRTRGALAIDSKKTWSFTPKCQKILAGFAQQFAQMADNALELAHCERCRLDIFSLGDYLDTLRACESEDHLLNAICLVPQGVLPFDGCFLVLREESEAPARLVRTSGFGNLFLGDIRVSDRSSVVGYALGFGEPIRLPDLKGPRGRRALFHPDEPVLDMRSVAVLPLAGRRGVIGALGFTSRRRHQFDTAMLRRADVIAGAVADALERLEIQRLWKLREEYDPVTGGFNARHLTSRLGEILREAEARGRRVSLIAVAPNGAEAHDFAFEERLIIHLAHLLRPYADNGDILVRQSGARFLLLLHGSSQEYSEAVAERILEDIYENPCPFGDREIPVTASVGVACYPEHASGPERLLAAALRSLSAARSEGVNPLCLHGGARP